MVFKISTSAQAPKRTLKHSKGAQVLVAKFSKILETCFFRCQRDLFWESLDMIYQILWPINTLPQMILSFLCEY